MTVTTWNLTLNGATTHTLAEWGLTRVQVTFNERAANTLQLSIPVDNCEGAPPFAHGDTLALVKHVVTDGTATDTPWFTGTVITPTAQRSPDRESFEFEAQNAWYRMSRQLFMVVWNAATGVVGGSLGAISAVAVPDIILNLDVNCLGVETDKQLGDAVEWARICGIAVQADKTVVGSTTTYHYPVMLIWPDQARCISITDVIERQTAFTPDAAVWIDESTSPYPTLRVKRHTDLTAVSLDISTLDQKPEDIEITFRDDLLPDAVMLWYRRVDNIDGRATAGVWKNAYPADATGQEPFILASCIDLKPYAQSSATYVVTCRGFNASNATDATRLAWWKLHDRTLVDPTNPASLNPYIGNLTIPTAMVYVTDDATGVLITDFSATPYELVDSNIASGLYVGGDLAVVREVTVRCIATYDLYKDTAHHLKLENRPRELSVRCKLTNVPTGTYRVVQSATAGEEPPVGMAELLYNAMHVRQADGRVSYTQAECDGAVRPGHKLNLTGGTNADWGTMGATVRAVTEDIVEGKTEIQFGAAATMSLPLLLEIMRRFRSRVMLGDPSHRTTGYPSDSSGFEVGNNGPRENSTHAAQSGPLGGSISDPNGSGNSVRIQHDADAGTHTIETLSSVGTPVSGKGRIVHALADTIKADTTEKEVRIREKGSGLVMCSDDFTAGGLTPRGDWLSSSTYGVNDMVEINDAGPTMGTYRATLAGRTSATPPWEGDGWRKLPTALGPWIGIGA